MHELLTAEELIERLRLQPHPGEGGYFRETYRSAETFPPAALPGRYRSRRAHGTAIYYLLTAGSVSAMHRLASDEVFHFYLGDPVRMLHLYPDGAAGEVILGTDVVAGMRPQVVVPAGVWQGARLAPIGRSTRGAPVGQGALGFALLGTTVAPGFEFEDFELGARRGLVNAYPAYADQIRALTPPIPGASATPADA